MARRRGRWDSPTSEAASALAAGASSDEARREAAQKMNEARWSGKSPEERAAHARAMALSIDPAARRESARRAAKARWAKRRESAA